MGSKSLNHLKTVALDSNIFSYQFHQDPTFGPLAKQVFEAASQDKLQVVTSVITLIEVLSVKAPLSKLAQLKELLLRTPNLIIVDVNQDLAIEAARIRRKYGFRTPDAIQLATAKLTRVKAFLTNDQKLKSFKALKIILLSEIG